MIEEQIRAIVRDEIAKSKAPQPKPAVLSEGCRFLRENEITQVGDLEWWGREWRPIKVQVQVDKTQVRRFQRKLTPSEIGEGWRILAKDEPVVDGDMFLDCYGDWTNTCPSFYNGKQHPSYPYRRRVETKTEPDPGEGWRLVDTEKDTPKEGDWVWLRNAKEWIVRAQCEKPFLRNYFYRRRITPEPKYREPTNADIGQMVEVQDDGDSLWLTVKLCCVLCEDYSERYVVDFGGDYCTWPYARIQEPAQ